MDISIVGAGAMGLLWAWRLRKAGHNVKLVCKHEGATRAITDGIKFSYRDKEERVILDASCDPRIVQDSSYIFLWVKSYDTREAALSIAPYLNKKQTIVTLQNGLGNAERIRALCPDTQIITGTTTAAAYLEGATLYAVSLGETTLGPMPALSHGELANHDATASLVELADHNATVSHSELANHNTTASLVDLLSDAGLIASGCADIETAIWEKAAVNAAINPLCALLNVKNGDLVGEPWILALQTAIIEEAARAASFRGISLDAALLTTRAQAVCTATAANYSSMLMDVRHGKKTEIDTLNGAIVSIAEQESGEAPVNKTMTALIHALETRKSNK